MLIDIGTQSSPENQMGSTNTTVVGVVVSVLIIGAVASIGYYQFGVAPYQTKSSTSVSTVSCTPSTCVNVTIPQFAGTPPPGYLPGDDTTFGYDPDTVSLVLGVNNTVVWTSSDPGSLHTSTDPGVFDSKDIRTGSFQFTFALAGTYHYTCIYHAWMQGTVLVNPA